MWGVAQMAWTDGGWDVTASDQCNPNHPMNQYIIGLQPSLSAVLDRTCLLMNTGLAGTERNLSGHVRDFVDGLRNEDMFRELESYTEEPVNYVLELTEEELQDFLTQLETFWCATRCIWFPIRKYMSSTQKLNRYHGPQELSLNEAMSVMCWRRGQGGLGRCAVHQHDQLHELSLVHHYRHH